MGKNVLVAKEAAIAIVTINRPEVLNAMDLETVAELAQVFHDLERDEEVRVVIVTGAGDRAFVAGGDIPHMRQLTFVDGRDFVYAGQALTRQIERSNKVVIAAVNGYALGGGSELALACDIRIASERAQFGFPEVSVGLIPGWGGTQRMARLVGRGKAKELVLTGDRIDATEAHRIGLVNKVVPHEQLMAAARDMAQRVIKNSPIAVQQAKKALNEGVEVSLDQGLAIEAEAWRVNLATEDRVEGLSAFSEKRPPRFRHR